jgi:hypothetical protein
MLFPDAHLGDAQLQVVQLHEFFDFFILGIAAEASHRIGLVAHGAQPHLVKALQNHLFDVCEERTARVNHNLGQTIMVTKVNEENAAMVTLTENPPRNTGGLVSVCSTKFVTRMGAIRMHNFSLSTNKTREVYHNLREIAKGK